jgi:hypothetical protein
MIAMPPFNPAAATRRPSGESASAAIGEASTTISPTTSRFNVKKRTCPSADAAMISLSLAITIPLIGAANLAVRGACWAASGDSCSIPSDPPDRIAFPSGVTRTAVTGPLCPSIVRSSVPRSRSQIRTVASNEPDTSRLPSGVTASDATGPWCPVSTLRGVAPSPHQSAIRPSSLAVAKQPSGCIATALTAPS